MLLILLALPFVFLGCEHVRGRVSLALYRHSLIAKGEKLTARDLASPPPQGKNGAPEVLQAQKELKEGQVLPKHYPPRMRLTPSGRAVVCFREEDWSDDKVTYRWDQLAGDLEIDGKPIKYRLEAGGAFVLYSVGADGKDDGGDSALLPDKTNFQNLWDRKDWVWPAPAQPDEIKAYRSDP